MRKKIFESVVLGNLPVKNRLVRSATYEIGGAENGEINSFYMEKMVELAQGGVGLIVTGLVTFADNAMVSDSGVRIDYDTFAEHFRTVCEKIHEQDAKIIVQLCHCGPKARLPQGQIAAGPSGGSFRGREVRELGRNEIKELVQKFVDGAVICENYGADGIQIHAAHGYLVSHFLSPIYNLRKDEYGGNTQNRARFLCEICERVRDAVGKEFHLSVKINCSDLIENGFDFQMCRQVCKMLEGIVDSVELSGGGFGTEASARPSQPVKMPGDESYFAKYALLLSEEIKYPVICVGGHRSIEKIEALLNAGNITAFSMSRPLICEPGLPNKWLTGEKKHSDCISCNACYKTKQLKCVLRSDV